MRLRKGESITDGIRPIIGTLIAALLIIFVALPFGISLYKIFQGQEDQGTRESLSMIDQKIRSTEHDTSSNTEVHIKNGLMIVGFNKGSNKVEETCCVNDVIWKPATCGDNACLCICDEGDCANPKRCIVYKIRVETEEESGVSGGVSEVGEDRDIDCFIGPSDDTNYGDSNSPGCSGESLVLYGNCDCDFSGDFQVQNLKITNKQDKNFYFEFINN